MNIVFQPNPPFAGYDESEPVQNAIPEIQAGYAAPIQLYGTTTIQSGSGESQIPNRAFTNLTNYDIEILKIAFAVKLPSSLAASYYSIHDLGSVAQVQMSLGSIPITTNYVPLWCLSRSEDRTWERLTSTYVWTLSNPLRLHPGECLNVTLKHNAIIQEQLTVDVTLQGRMTTVRQAGTRKVPFAAVYAAPTIQFGTASSSVSKETDLINNTSRQVHIDRLIGRVASYSVASGATWFEEEAGPLSNLITLGLVSSTGKTLIRDDIKWPLVFPPSSRSLELNDCHLDPDEHWTLTLNTAVGGVNYYSAFSLVRGYPQVSLIGWREV